MRDDRTGHPIQQGAWHAAPAKAAFLGILTAFVVELWRVLFDAQGFDLARLLIFVVVAAVVFSGMAWLRQKLFSR
jgi:hypothetical protein